MNAFNFPTLIAFIHANQQISYFRIKFSLDGKVKLLKSNREPSPEQLVLYILDITLVFKRSSAINQSQLKSRQHYLSVAEGLFPFDSEKAFYAMSTINTQNYFFAIEKIQLNSIINHLPGQKRAVLITEDDPDARLKAVQKWLKRTPFLDLLSKPLSVPFYSIVNGAYFIVTLFLFIILFLYGSSLYQEHLQSLDSQFIALEKKAKPLYIKQNLTSSMQQSYQQLLKFSKNCSSYSLSVVEKIINKTPENSRLSSIQFENGQLTIKGKSSEIDNWFSNDTLFKEIKIDSSPEYDHFTATISCEELIQSTTSSATN